MMARIEVINKENPLVNIEEVELQKITAAMHDLYSTWNEIGIEMDQQIDRVQTAWSHIQSLIQDICQEEADVCEDIKSKIKEYTENISKLSQLLGVETSDLSGLSLLKREAILHKDFDSLLKLKEKRIQELEELKKQEKYYCLLLDAEEFKISSEAEVPTPKDLNELRHQVNRLSEEYSKKYGRYCQLGQELLEIFKITETIPNSPLEKHLCEGKDPLSLSGDTFKAIEEILEKARKGRLELETRKKHLMDKLLVLWNRLNIENNIRMEFLSAHLDCKASTLKSIQDELVRCEELKKRNLKVFIDSMKQELNELWSKCGVSESEKQFLLLKLSAEVSEDVLIALEKETDKWKAYYEEVKTILEKIEKRNKLWELLIVLDGKASDPARFKNRGGNLLKEEKERNKLQKSLPPLEKDIQEEIRAYETKTGKTFLYLGEDYRSQICKQWKVRSSHKENCKPDKNVQFCTPLKRPLLTEPKSAPCPRYKKLYTPIKATPKTAKKPLSRPKVIKKRDLDILKEVNKNKEEIPVNDTTYSDFANELNRSVRRSFRSTIVCTKVGGTRTPSTLKKKRKSVKCENTPDKHVVLTTVRGKAGLPFVM